MCLRCATEAVWLDCELADSLRLGVGRYGESVPLLLKEPTKTLSASAPPRERQMQNGLLRVQLVMRLGPQERAGRPRLGARDQVRRLPHACANWRPRHQADRP